MHPTARSRRPWRAALAGLAAGAAAGAMAAGLAQGLDMRGDLDAAAAPVARAADDLAARLDGATPAQARAAFAQDDLTARLLGPAGRVRAEGGDAALWGAGAAGPVAAAATAGADGWSVRDGAVEARRATASGGTVVVRAALGPGATRLDPLGLAAGALIGGLIGALWAGLAAGRRDRRLRAMRVVADAAADGRAPATIPAGLGGGEWRALAESVGAAADTARALQGAAQARMDALGAAMAPLPLPVAARTPSGGLIRNDALERLTAGLGPADAEAIDVAVAAGLSAGEPMGARLTLGDGRALELEAWSVPGGRVVVIGERTEQERLAAVRRQVSASAARHLQTPIAEIRARSAELVALVPAAGAPALSAVRGAADRLDRMVGQLLRGTGADPRSAPATTGPVGVAGLAYGLGARFDRRLRDRGLRLETDLPADLPAVRADAALVNEILGELIANSATHTPRGGTIILSGRTSPEGRVVLSVRDTGPGIRADEIDLVAEPFGRGENAAGLPGAGLGLGVARALAERLGGRLTLRAGPGMGAQLELPAHRPEDDAAPDAPSRAGRTPVAA